MIEPEFSFVAKVLVTVGGLFVVGLAADLLGRNTPLPRVTVLLAAGFAIGPSGLDWLPDFMFDLFPMLTSIALAMVGFLLGERLTGAHLKGLGTLVLGVSLSVVVVTSLIVALALILFGAPVELALVLGGIATATAPAATADVVHEYGSDGRFSKILLAVVAIDDAWALLLFSALLAIAQGIVGEAAPAVSLLAGIADILVAVIVGLVVGFPVAYLTGRVRPGEPTQAEALGSVLLTAGIAVWLDVSYILSALVLGMTVASLARHHSRPFHAIEGIEWPFLILFFFLAGASLDLQHLENVGWVGLIYIVMRIAGRIVGGQLGAKLSGAEPLVARWIGLALLPQAGVAVGLALLACQRLPELETVILPVVLGSTVFFELTGPVATRAVLAKIEAADHQA